ncbi:sugar O-acetyltransferase [Arcanobacterium pinnipediorum]|uniref:Sugar O-acetyltransferase n=1 Tax=Arcanobacterium pinnipediorum TaxID=1503041 RepID=A0ABY5AH14_9ACTO|nr:sugar O-acetyltransferase [Arcanobacterium pinnipediorum]USR78986.1 sugar O-acetyltransferase [Arcanobacterium pinnipediorum]
MKRDEELYDRMINGQLYTPQGPKFQEIHARAMKYQDEFNSLPAADWDAHYAVLTHWLGEVGEGVIVRAPLRVDYGIHTSIGAGTFVNYDCIFLDVAPITIGKNCQIAPRVQLLTAWHPLEPTLRSQGWEGGSPIHIGDNVWLGAGVIVLPGVTIGDNTVIGAGSVVTKDIPANVVALGSPAQVVKKLPADQCATDVIPPHLLN